MADLRHRVGYVSQDLQLFYGSIRENISFGAPYADGQAILRAANLAGVTDFVRGHPAGFDWQVGERGANLSGGQRQAVAIARALLLDPEILILDEPTSAMDNAAEAQFRQRLGSVLNGKTLLLCTHRTSMLELVDRVVVMDGGKVVADGPKADVLKALRDGKVAAAR
jgi:ATP-binding cassette subfamily C protein LapB